MYLPDDEEPDLSIPLTRQQLFRKYIHYDPVTGEINRILTGRWFTPCFKPVTFTRHRHENNFSIKGINYSARSAVWCYMTGHYPNRKEYIVSLDGDITNLQFSNLRLKTRSEVIHQTKLNKVTLGARVVYNGKYSAKIGFEGKQIHLGTFETEQLARVAYMKKKVEILRGTV
jgi:hypothetical protein